MSQFQRIRDEINNKLPPEAEDAWKTQEHKEMYGDPYRRATEEYEAKAPAAKRAWLQQKIKDYSTPKDIDATPAARDYAAEFAAKAPAMKAAFDAAPAKPKMGGKAKKAKKVKKTQKAKKMMKHKRTKTAGKRSQKKRLTAHKRR